MNCELVRDERQKFSLSTTSCSLLKERAHVMGEKKHKEYIEKLLEKRK